MTRQSAPAMSKQDPKAQSAAARLLAAACRGQSRLWAEQEHRHEFALTPADAVAAAEPLLEFCIACPIVTECEQWAEAEEFDGIAAGSAWAAGDKRPVDWVRSQPLRGTTKHDRTRQGSRAVGESRVR
jgi:hypothetical protein